jgi:soluble cytochrome b562
MFRTRTIPAFLAAAMAFSFVPQVRADDTPLAKAMDEMGDHYKALKKIIKDPAKNAESLALVDKSIAAAVISKAHMPKVIEKAPEAEKAKLIAGYRKAMAEVIAAYCKLEIELVEGKNEQAAETLKTLKDLEEKGHEVYNP